MGPAALAEKRKDLKFDACTWPSRLEVYVVLRVYDAVFSKDVSGPFGYEEDIQTMLAPLLPIIFLSSAHLIRHHSHFSGTTLSDTAFYHAKSKTLVVGDLIYNLPNTESMPTYKSSIWKSLSPGGSVHTKLVNGAAKDRAAVQADAKTVAALNFDRIIPLHGVSIFNQCCLHSHDADYVGRTLSKRVD